MRIYIDPQVPMDKVQNASWESFKKAGVYDVFQGAHEELIMHNKLNGTEYAFTPDINYANDVMVEQLSQSINGHILDKLYEQNWKIK